MAGDREEGSPQPEMKRRRDCYRGAMRARCSDRKREEKARVRQNSWSAIGSFCHPWMRDGCAVAVERRLIRDRSDKGGQSDGGL
jgi:hypothetical protein